tara:strand:- start:3 stop:989 length:987 start_codon:yes stop_codon:yes gene_type:complete
MANMFSAQTAESILRDRQNATRKNTMGILAQAKRGKNTEEQIGVDIGSILANMAIGAFTDGDASGLGAVRALEANAANIQQSISDVEAGPLIPGSSYLGQRPQPSQEMLQSLTDSKSALIKNIDSMDEELKDAYFAEKFEKGIEENPSLLTDNNAMIQHALNNRQVAQAMKFTNLGIAKTKAKETEKTNFIKSLIAADFTPTEALQKYKEFNNLGKEPEGSSVVNAPRPTTNNANFKSPEELLGGAKNSPEEEGFLVNLAKNYAGTVEATDEQVANYARKNNIKGIKSKQDLETLRKKASDELNQETNKNRSDNSSYSSFKTWLQQNL